MSEPPTMLVILDAGTRNFRRVRQACALVVRVDATGRICEAVYRDDRTPPDLPVIEITFRQFQALARAHQLIGRQRLSEEDARRRRAESQRKYRDRLRRQRRAIIERQRRIHAASSPPLS